MSSYLAIGSVCWDVIEGDDSARLGGSVLFACRVAHDAGWDAHLVTSGTEQLDEAVRAALPGVEITVQRSSSDTVMAFSRNAEIGPQAVPTVADPIDLHLLDGMRSTIGSADVVHLAPIMGEVTSGLAHQVRAGRFVGITPQGLLRSRAPNTGALGRLPVLDAWWTEVVDAAVVSEDEYALLAEPGALGELALAVTQGEQGCFGRWGEELIEVAGIGRGEVLPERTIGAGDVFAAAFFMALSSGEEFAAALHHANRTAAAYVGAHP